MSFSDGHVTNAQSGWKDSEKMSDYEEQYSDSDFWAKVKKFAKVMGKGVMKPALQLYYSGIDPDTPMTAKTVIFGALGYLISPIDAIPDITPVVGYADDLGVLVAAVAVVGAHIKQQHTDKADETLLQWFGPDDD